MDDYVNAKTAKKYIGICTRTLQNYDKEGKIEVIRTAGGRRRYNIKKYLKDNNIEIIKEERKNIIYGRVSSYDRKNDLDRQVQIFNDVIYNNICNNIFYIFDKKRCANKPIYDENFKKDINKVKLIYFIKKLYSILI